jgi:small-conductance mechanosensitive channel
MKHSTQEAAGPGRSSWLQRSPIAVAFFLTFAAGVMTVTGAEPLGDHTARRPPAHAAEETVGLADRLQAKLLEAQTDFRRFQTEQGSATHLPPGATQAEAIEYRSFLQMLVQTYQAHLDYLKALEAVRQRHQEFARTTQTWSGFTEPPPYSILVVDELRDTLQTAEDQIELAETGRAFVDQMAANVEESMKECDGQLRRLNEQLEGTTDRERNIRLNWQRELALVRSRWLAASLSSFGTIRQKVNEEAAEGRLRQSFGQRQLTLAAQHVRFTQSDFDKAVSNLNAESTRLEAEFQAASIDLENRKRELAVAREEYARKVQEPLQTEAASESLRRLQAVVDLRNAQVQTGSEVISGLRQLLEGVGIERQVWQMRFAVFEARNVEELQKVYRKLERLNDFVRSAKQYFVQQGALIDNQVSEQQHRLLNASGETQDNALEQELLETYQKRALINRRVLDGVEKRERLILRWKGMLDWNRKTLPFADRVRDLFSEATHFLSKLWTFELVVVDDTITVDGQTIQGRRGVTVGKIVLVALILVVGFWISNLIALLLQKLTIHRFKVEQNQANLIRRWVRFLLITCLVLFSLALVKIPLTIFAFAGGALAIGVGFGTQNLLKNFISGIIILFERPFRVGDVLDIDGRHGTVTGIGLRSSIVLFWDGVETLIPNSALLENNLTNWTYSSRTVRFTIKVGVAYGSDTNGVSRLLAEVADRHGLVLKDPKPQVLFCDFSDSTLCFELRFWVDVLKTNSAQVSSDLRHMIASTFADHGISMAFPQRDVHLDASRPLRVEVT